MEVRNSLLLKKATLIACSRESPNKCETFAQWAEIWGQNELIGNVKLSSYQTYLNILNHHLLPVFGHYMLASINAEIIQNYIEELEQKGFAKSTIQEIIRFIIRNHATGAARRNHPPESLSKDSPLRKWHIGTTCAQPTRIKTHRRRYSQ